MHREGHVGAALLAYAPVGMVTLALGFDRQIIIFGVSKAEEYRSSTSISGITS